MAVTTTARNSLLNNLKQALPDIIFAPGEVFRWSAAENTVFYEDITPQNTPLLLHEAAHGVLGHSQYKYDIDLIKLEREAWSKAVELGEQFKITIDPETIEEALDTYRDWLHLRSTCPTCSNNGLQVETNTYACVVCHQKWHVNDARNCGLKRMKL